MGQFNLNLSTRPFKPYRAANLGLMVLLIVLIAVSVVQVYTYQHNSSLAADIRDSERKAKEESDLLTKQLQDLNAKMYSSNAATKLTQVEFLNQILKRKSFSWTTVFANLERVMPENVYLLTMSPFVDEKGLVGLNIVLRGRTFEDAKEFVSTLEDSGIFGQITVAKEEKKDANPSGEVEFALSAYYYPEDKKGAE
jgi:Tfp pilus assembly protein PilN